MLTELSSDLRFGFRMMFRNPGFTAVALLTMALGIGANTAMFSVLNGVVLSPLEYPDPERIVILTENNLSEGWATFSVSPMNFWDWQEQNRSLELLGAYQRESVNFTGGDQPEVLRAYFVTEEYLEILGGQPMMGRGFLESDMDPGQEPVVILSHGFWQRAFGGDPEILGRTVILDAVIHTVIGVQGEGFRVPGRSQADVFLPMRPEPWWFDGRGAHFIYGVGRLRSTVSLEQARADFSAIASGLEEEYPDTNAGWGINVRPLQEVLLGAMGPQLFIFMASVGLVLLIACANMANMTLARSTVRARELAIRTALGAGRGRVLRQLLAESVLLAGAGGILGVFLAHLGLRAFVAGWPTLLPRMHSIELDGTVLVFSGVLILASGILFGLVPALSAVGPSMADALRQGSRGTTGGRSRRWMRSGLVVSEVGLAVILLVGTGLLVRSFSALRSEDPGFETDDRLVFSTPLSDTAYPDAEDIFVFTEAALAALQSLPGVESAALTSLIPLEGSDNIWGFRKEGTPASEPTDLSPLFYRVTPGYFETMGIPLLAGRDIGQQDGAGAKEVVVVSASAAETLYPGENPIGKRIRFGRAEDSPPVEIIGVVGEVQHYSLGETSIPQIYVSFAQRPGESVSWVLKTRLPPLAVAEGVREAITGIDPNQPLVGLQSLDALISAEVSTPRFRTLLMAGFGLTALLLSVVGLYGVMAYSVSQRSKEIGVRMALGATRVSVLSLVFREGMPLLALGLVLGTGGALAFSRILEAMLFGVGARDPVVFTGVPLILAAVAAAAIFLPARKATRVDPVRTLGEE